MREFGAQPVLTLQWQTIRLHTILVDKIIERFTCQAHGPQRTQCVHKAYHTKTPRRTICKWFAFGKMLLTTEELLKKCNYLKRRAL